MAQVERILQERTHADFLYDVSSRRGWSPRSSFSLAAARRAPDEKEDESAWRECCVCLGPGGNHVAQPCFHMCACAVCARRLTRCPLCRTLVRSWTRARLS